MFKKFLFLSFLGNALALSLAGNMAAAEEGSSNIDFYDRGRLVATAMADEQATLDAALATAQSAAAGDLQALNAHVAAAQAAYRQERATVQSLVDRMPDDQLFAFNRSLNNAVNHGLVVNLDAKDLRAAIDGHYDKPQINALTKALEEEAKFIALAVMFEQKAAETGDGRFLEKADKMRQRAEDQKELFLSKIDAGSNHDAYLDDDASRDHRPAAADGAEKYRDAARDIESEAARSQREAAKEALREQREAAKEAAREAADEAAKEAQDAAKEDAEEEDDD